MTTNILIADDEQAIVDLISIYLKNENLTVFPFYTGLVVALWYGAGCFWDISRYEPWWLAAVGLTWGFHITFTVYLLSQRQPDIQENGRLFSYIIIYLASLFFVAIWIIAIGTPTLRGAWNLLFPETLTVYSGVWSAVLTAGERLRPLLSGAAK